MKTKQELLDFYGVEIGKKYKVTKIYERVPKDFVGEIFKIRESPAVDDLIIMFTKHSEHSIRALNYLDYEEYKPILDDTEREYLQHYVMNNPAFKGKVAYITKTPLNSKSTESIEITTTKYDDDFACFPCFKQGSMYKNMKLNKRYTPKELGLEE